MINIQSETTIDRPAGQIFQFLTNHTQAQDWLTGLIETRPTSDTQGVGYTWIDVVKMFGRKVETEFEITAFETDQLMAFKSIDGPVPSNGSYAFTPSDSGTRVTFTLEAEPQGFFKLAAPVVQRITQRQWDANLANLKDVIEMSEPEEVIT
jgi:uncharacterized membrane protein